MIDVWLKTKVRRSKHLPLMCLHGWLGQFSDPSKYRIWIYNEDFPNFTKDYHDAYTILNRNQILQNPLCAQLQRKVEHSKISQCWSKAASALVFGAYYLYNSEYLFLIDADDVICPGWNDSYTDQIINAMKSNNLAIMSYDYIFSHNPFNPPHPRNFLPHHWSFGVSCVNGPKFRQEILEPIFTNTQRLLNYIPQINLQWECNLDILVSTFLQRERPNDRYYSFITKEGFYHLGFPHTASSSQSKLTDNQFHWNFEGNDIRVPLHPKTLVLT